MEKGIFGGGIFSLSFVSSSLNGGAGPATGACCPVVGVLLLGPLVVVVVKMRRLALRSTLATTLPGKSLLHVGFLFSDPIAFSKITSALFLLCLSVRLQSSNLRMFSLLWGHSLPPRSFPASETFTGSPLYYDAPS